MYIVRLLVWIINWQNILHRHIVKYFKPCSLLFPLTALLVTTCLSEQALKSNLPGNSRAYFLESLISSKEKSETILTVYRKHLPLFLERMQSNVLPNKAMTTVSYVYTPLIKCIV